MTWDWDKLREQQDKKGFGQPPNLDDIKNKFNKVKMPGGPLIVIILVILAGLASSTFYTIGVDEAGVVQQFGKFVRISKPGLNFKWPAGIEKVTKLKVKRIYKKEFGFRSARSTSAYGYSETENATVSLMLTGDLNVALVPWIVQYRIADPYRYLFKVRNPEKLLGDMAEASMRLVVGDRSINEVITKRVEIADEARKILQEELDMAESGITIRTIEMKKTNVPGPVQPSFNEVNQAVQEKETMIYQANEDYNKAIPAARGEAERTVRAAEGYALDRVNRAKGNVSRFIALQEEYLKAKEVTKRRLYLETMEKIFPKIEKKYIIDSKQKNILPLLNLEKQTAVK